jgi:TetR/AcrR family transcriptional repressor of bet genes
MQIARAFRRVMAKRGYEGTSIGEVARVAKLTPGLVHYHFESKLEILLDVLEDLSREHQALLQAVLFETPPRRRLDAFIDVHLAAGKSADPERLACWISIGAEALRDSRVREGYHRAWKAAAEQLMTVLRDGARAGHFRESRLDAAAAGILALIQGYFSLATTARDLIPPGSAAASAKRMAAGLLEAG